MMRVKSCSAYLMGLTTYGNYNIEDTVSFTVYIPKTDEHLQLSLSYSAAAYGLLCQCRKGT